VASSVTGLSQGQGRVGRRRPSPLAAMRAERDPWSRTLAALLQFSEPQDESLSPADWPEHRYPPTRVMAGRAHAKSFTVTFLERLANSRVCLSWHDPTLCNYEEQVWAPALARRSGRCALSGAHIQRGDTVYRPQSRGRTPPANGDAMILASALAQVPDG
jgi:hypothetical protein